MKFFNASAHEEAKYVKPVFVKEPVNANVKYTNGCQLLRSIKFGSMR